jgi:uncharacterized protein YbjT (DUF2867 family)
MILIVGATGRLGGLIADRLLAQGRPVRALVRGGSDHRHLAEAGADLVLGDLKDRASLDRAVQGADVVITTANSAMRGGEDTVDTVEIEGNRNLIDAAKAAGVSQFIFVSGLGASEDSPSPFLRGKALAERYLRESGVPFTILTANIFMEVWIPAIVAMPVRAGQPVTLVGEGRRRHTFVSMRDVAAFAIAAIGNPQAIGQQILIGGPLAISWRDIIDSAGRAIGREIPIRYVAPGDPIPGLPREVSDIAASFETFDSPIEMSETAARFGVSLTTIEEFVDRTFRAV